MDNEEKIITMLEVLSKDMNDVKDRLTNLETGQKTLEAGQKALEAGQKTLETGVALTNLRIENDLIPGMKLLLEGRQLDRDNIKEMKNTIDEMSETVLALDILHIKK